MKLRIKKLVPNAIIPKYAHHGDSGFDLYATEDVIVYPNQTVRVPIGLAFDIPFGYEMQIRPRSGVTSKTKLRVQLGTVDSGYKGEVKVMVDNIASGCDCQKFDNGLLGIDGKVVDEDFMNVYDVIPNTYVIKKGDRIAQGIIAPVIEAEIEETDDVGTSERGSDGFGSTGVN